MKVLVVLIVWVITFISCSSDPPQLHHLGVSEKTATYLLKRVKFQDIDTIEGMWAKRGTALNGVVTIVLTGQGDNLVSCDFAYEVRRDESRNDPDYYKNVFIFRIALLQRFLTNVLGERVAKKQFVEGIGSVLGKVRDTWDSAWSVKIEDKILLIFTDSNRDIIHVTIMPSLLPGHFLQRAYKIPISIKMQKNIRNNIQVQC